MNVNPLAKIIETIDDYYAIYNEENALNDSDKIKNKKAEALKMALDTRKFEIELYWKRATYFSTFIGLVFTSYFLVAVAENIKPSELRYELLLIISSVGVFSSL